MSIVLLRRWAYRSAVMLGLVYVGYVLVLKVLNRTSAGPLGDVGEFLLVLASVSSFAIGLFADERQRSDPSEPSPHPQEETP
jgi:hypothetical protein